jgi:hypothetical protein
MTAETARATTPQTVPGRRYRATVSKSALSKVG